ncbi:MAG: pyridoxal phosphate-dependent aminotransferase family protein [Planctomycetes bacterium]|nr:pyridoxal phosphate-dependent aminotransferase family protein [Planctomycetota bacterium]
MDLFHKCRTFTRAKEAQAEGWYPYFKPIGSGADAEVVIDGKKMIMIGSNNYLGLTQHPKVKAAAIEAVKNYGSGCTGSRFLNGTLDIHEHLETGLADFMKKESALVFSTGFQTNQGTIYTLVGKDDTIVIDRGDHASIMDGCRLAFGKTIKYRHNDMKDLERILSELERPENTLVIVDGVFSMEGDLADLPKICELKKKYKFKLMVDDAHGIGVMGKNGRGTAEHFGVEDQVDLIMGTFSKSFASIGGFICGEESVIHYIKHFSRALIFSASMPPAAVAAVLASLDIIKKEPERRQKLWKNVNRIRDAFKKFGFDTAGSETPIIPIVAGGEQKVFMFWKDLYERGLFANPVIPPAVAPEHCLIRTSYMATHTDEQIDKVIEICGQSAKAVGLANL